MTIEHLVAIANGFFLSSALYGILAAIRIFPSRRVKITAGGLACCFIGILLFSSLPVLLALTALTTYFVRKQRTHWKLYPELGVEIPS